MRPKIRCPCHVQPGNHAGLHVIASIADGTVDSMSHMCFDGHEGAAGNGVTLMTLRARLESLEAFYVEHGVSHFTYVTSEFDRSVRIDPLPVCIAHTSSSSRAAPPWPPLPLTMTL